MIRAHLNYCDNQIAGFKLTGHADAGEYGQDIVCAAVSVLAINTVNSLEQLAKVTPQVISDDEQGGYLEVKLSDDQVQHPEAQLLLQSFELGLQDIEKNYDKYIKIK
ncbi:MAG TPA: ribosomal-processing cysteine protease Prp [Candidatus Ligilactobacillus excrementigallinarum]|uniref:Ribosomal processing cysteine protease Prp n=1 Tax=Candidatus Ligilactobacillus excrementigallinarum TaxID=2838641 RepID=A0A9D1UW78_9LACO|nr:ribosomal-processing cysteine protease Prp [Candidatus Ligilactobacillus excrementigallinarum]